MRTWLSQKLAQGFWYPAAVWLLDATYRWFSLSYRFKHWLRKNERNPPGAAELYQLAWLVVLVGKRLPTSSTGRLI